MLNISDFWEIFKVVYNNDPNADVSEVIRNLALSEKSNITNYFTNVIDQIPHNTSDYKRIKNFLISWYSSLKTLGTVQRKITDPRVLPEEELDDLFQSFGYDFSNELTLFTQDINENKVNFLLDLVNLYKIKGTPEGLKQALSYYGLSEFNIYEYWLRLNENYDLIFRPKVVTGNLTLSSLSSLNDVPYNTLTGSDPHWFLTKSQYLNILNNKKIKLPSKSPYFSIKPSFNNDILNGVISILSRNIQDQYIEYLNTGTILPKDVQIKKLGYQVSLLELYLGIIYLFNSYYDIGFESSNNFLCYNGDSTSSSDIIDIYTDLINTSPTSRSNIIVRYNLFFDLFTREISTNFLIDKNSAGYYLNLINPSLKVDLDSLTDSPNPKNILISLISDLSRWIRYNIGSGYPNLGFLIFGKEIFDIELKNVINFFKPYRSRLVLVEDVLIFNNKLMDSHIIEDYFIPKYRYEKVWDYNLGNSQPCALTNDHYARETLDCGSYFDMGACKDEIEITLNDILVEYPLICHNNDSTSSDTYIFNDYSMDSSSEVVYAIQSSGFVNFDEGGVFDCTFGNEIVEIYVV